MIVRPAWAEIDLKAIAHNVQEFKRIIKPNSLLCAVVKANAYGHGAVEISQVALDNGANYLAVATVAEAIQLRTAGFNVPILILGYTPPEMATHVVRYNITQTITDFSMAKSLSDAAAASAQKVKVHIKVDSGMSRIGFYPGPESVQVIKQIAKLPNLEIEGAFTHFAVSDIVDKTFTLAQFSIFTNFLDSLQSAGIDIKIRHAANSAAIIDLPETHLDMVRLGISLYGLYPSDEVHKENISLQPAMTLKAKVVQVKKIPPGISVSYGRTWQADKEAVVATLPLGYADGYTRLLSNKGEILVHGQRANIIGRICMDQCMADVSHIPDVQTGDEVVLFGAQIGAVIPVEEVAAKIGTINYEVVCMVSPRIPRIYLK